MRLALLVAFTTLCVLLAHTVAAESFSYISCGSSVGDEVPCTQSVLCNLLSTHPQSAILYTCTTTDQISTTSFKTYVDDEECNGAVEDDAEAFFNVYGQCSLQTPFQDCSITESTTSLCPTNANAGCIALANDISKADTCGKVQLWLKPSDNSAAVQITSCPKTTLPPGTLECRSSDSTVIDTHPACQIYKNAYAACEETSTEMCYDEKQTNFNTNTVLAKGSCLAPSTSETSPSWPILPATRCGDVYVRTRPICHREYKTTFSYTGFSFGTNDGYFPQNDCTEDDTSTSSITIFLAPTTLPTACTEPNTTTATSVCIKMIDGAPVLDGNCVGLCDGKCVSQSLITSSPHIGCHYQPLSGPEAPLQLKTGSSCPGAPGVSKKCCVARCGLSDNFSTTATEDECSDTDASKFNPPSSCGTDFTRKVAILNTENQPFTTQCTEAICDAELMTLPVDNMKVTAITTPNLSSVCLVESRCPTGPNNAFEPCSCSKSTCTTRKCTVETMVGDGDNVWVDVDGWVNEDYQDDVKALCPISTCTCPIFGCTASPSPTASDLDTSCQTEAGFEVCGEQCSKDGEGEVIGAVEVTRNLYCVGTDGTITPSITSTTSFKSNPNCPEITPDATIDAIFVKECPQVECEYIWLCGDDVGIAAPISSWPTPSSLSDLDSFLSHHDCSKNKYSSKCYTAATEPGAVAPDDIIENVCPATGTVTDKGFQSRRVACYSYDASTGHQIIMDSPICHGTKPDVSKDCGAQVTGCFMSDIVVRNIDDDIFSVEDVNFSITYTSDFVPFTIQAVDLDGVNDEIDADDESLTYISLGNKINSVDIVEGKFAISLNSLTFTKTSQIFFRFVFDNDVVVYPTIDTTEDKTTRYTVIYIKSCQDLTCGGSEWKCQEYSITDNTTFSDAKCLCTDSTTIPENHCLPCTKSCPKTSGVANDVVCGCKLCAFGYSSTYCDNCDQFVALILTNSPQATRTLLSSIPTQSTPLSTDQLSFLSKIETTLEGQIKWTGGDLEVVSRQIKVNETTIIIPFIITGLCPSSSSSSFSLLSTTNQISALAGEWDKVDLTDYIATEFPNQPGFTIQKSAVWDPLKICTSPTDTTKQELCPEPDWFGLEPNTVDCVTFSSHPLCADEPVVDPPDPQNDDKASATTIIIAIVVPVVAVLIILAVIILLCCFCANDRKNEREARKPAEENKKLRHNKRGSTTDHLELT